MNETLNI